MGPIGSDVARHLRSPNERRESCDGVNARQRSLVMLGFGVLGGLAPLAAQPIDARPVQSRIEGTVYDSLTMRPLAGAVVQLATVPVDGRVGAIRTAQTDSAGRYVFASVGSGTYLLGFQHVAMDSLGIRGPVHRVDVRTDTRTRVPLAIPSPMSIVTSACGPASLDDSVAILVGSVRDARTDAPLGGGFLSLRWGEVVLGRGGMHRETPIIDVFADEEGWYRACVPGNTPVLTRATHGLDVSGDVELTLAAHTVQRRDLYVGPAEASIVGGDSVRRAGAPNDGERIVVSGTGVVRGVVRAIDGRPVPDVRVRVQAGATEARSDAQGRFTLATAPQGTHTIEARAIGYLPAQAVVDIVAFREAAVAMELVDLRAYLLDTMRVAAVRRLDASARAGFERRRRAGTGYFLDESQLDTITAFSFKDLIRSIPGVRFSRGTRIDSALHEYIEFTRGAGAAPCRPTIYLDGAQLIAGSVDLDQVVSHATVRRIEVYHRGVAVPAEFASADRCGVLAIWTGPRRNTGRPPDGARP